MERLGRGTKGDKQYVEGDSCTLILDTYYTF